MANTYQAIATVTVGSGGAANIEFTSIPATYTDLQVLLAGRSTSAFVADDLFIQFNSSSSNFSYRTIYSTGSGTPTSGNGTTNNLGVINGANSTASVFSNSSIYITNYASSNSKAISFENTIENNATRGDLIMVASLWANSAAITSIKLLTGANFAQYSTATIYGIKNS